MEIYIDNKKLELGKRNRKNFEKILKVITKKLEQNEKIIRNIYINGNILEDNTIINMDEPNILEVETKSYVDLILESLENCKNYIETFFEILFYLNLKQENNEEIIKVDIEEIHSFIMWFAELMQLIDETYYFENSDSFNEIIIDLNKDLKKLVEKRKKKLYSDYINLLRDKIANRLEIFYDNTAVYFEKILDEERNKKLII